MHPVSAGVALFVEVDEMFYLYLGAAVVGVVHTPHHLYSPSFFCAAVILCLCHCVIL